MSRPLLPAIAMAIVVLIPVLAISGCGGNPGGQTAAQSKLQDRHPGRSMKQASAPYATAVQELYVAYFGRPADPSGLTNFENALAAAQAPTDLPGITSAYSTNQAVKTLIDSFGTSKESQTLYGSGTSQDFVTAVFKNVLGRAPQQAGLSFWSDAIDKGSLSKGDAALAIMNGAQTNTTAQGQIDAQLVNNRLAVAASFTTQVANDGATNAYSGAAAAASARAMLAEVDSTTNTGGFAATVNSTIAGLLQSVPGITLVAGNTAAAVPLEAPSGLVRDASGNLYVLDERSGVLDKIAPDGTLTTLAGAPGTRGSADGTGAAANFNYPHGLAIDSKGNLYVADTLNNAIRKVTAGGVVSTVAGQAGATGSSDGAGQSARFNDPEGVAVDASGNLYVTDGGNQTVRKITPDGVVSTIAGQALKCGYADGAGKAAQFCNPGAIVVDTAGSIFLADSHYATIRKITPDGTVSTIAGNTNLRGLQDGTGAAAQFCTPSALAFDNEQNLLVSDVGCIDRFNPTIRKVTPAGAVSTIAGNNSAVFVNQTGVTAAFGTPEGLAMDGSGNIFVADFSNDSIWKVSASGAITTFAGGNGVTGSTDGTGTAAGFSKPQGIAADIAGNLYVADELNDTVRKITQAGVVSTLAGALTFKNEQNGTGIGAHFDLPTGLAINADGNIYTLDVQAGTIRIISPAGVTTSLKITGDARYLGFSNSIAFDQAGNLYICDGYYNGVYKITPDGFQSILAGVLGPSGSSDNVGVAAEFSNPSGVAVDGAGNVYVADTGNNTIRKIDGNGNVTTAAGSPGSTGFTDGVGTAARFHSPVGLAFDPAGNMYIADSANNAIRKMTSAGVVSTVAGTASGVATVLGALPGAVNRPQYLTVVGTNTLFVTSDNAVLRIQLP
jgi:sugar lactone lactonase YvrE